ncbi:MAG: amidase [Pseudomonadota bacterium]
MMDPYDNATRLTAELAERRLSAADLMDATYDRIEAVNPGVNALVSLLPRDEALALARAADGQAPVGPLHGLPLAVKDLANAAGFPTSQGSPIFAGAGPATHDDIMVARMRAAGAIVIGKTNVPEFGLGSHTINPVFGPTRNPFDPSRSAGGSSGGAAVALAAGMLALADGSDFMGSLRNPAGWNNVYGFRPSWGLVPPEPRGDSFLHQLSTHGPMARSPEDLALLLRVQAGPDPRQPHGIALAEAQAEPRPMRIGWLGDWGGAYPMEDGVVATCEGALLVLEGLGHEVTPCEPGFAADALWRSWTDLRSWQTAASLDATAQIPGAVEQLKPEARWELERGRAISGLDVHRASVTRTEWYTQALRLFERFDVLALPTAQCWPFPVEAHWPKEIAGRVMDTYHRWMEVVIPASMLGLPALAVPAGFGAAGLPMGLQLIGPKRHDLDLLALAQPYHEAAPWAERRPEL